MSKMRRIDGELITQGKGLFEPFCPCRTAGFGLFQKFKRSVDKGGDKLWERFIILPNIEGQKYTFGEFYQGREEQGEFIFFDRIKRRSESEKKEQNPLCEITIVKNQYWIVSCKENMVWINGVNIEKRTRTRLNFGDLLHLGEKVECGKEDHRSGFWFREREMDPGAFELEWWGEEVRLKWMKQQQEDKMALKVKNKKMDPSIEFTPGKNELVLSHILSYLDFRHLKQARLVSKLWNKEAEKIMRKRYFVHFEISYYTRPESLMSFFRYAQEMKNTQMTNWKFRMDWNWESFYRYQPTWGNLKAKLNQDFDWFLGEHHIKRLNLETEIYSAFDFEINIKILDHVQHTLQDLDLSWNLKSNATEASEKDCQLLSTIRLKKLKTFTLSFEGEDADGDHPSSYIWLLEPLLEAIKEVSTIRLDTAPKVNSYCLQFIKKSHFPNLVATEISLKNDVEYNPEDLKCVLQLDKPLTRLELTTWDLTDGNNAPYLEKLFLKHSKTLQHLHFAVAPSDQPGIINLPVFPNLKQLIVGIYYKKFYRRPEEVKPTCILKFLNPNNDGIIDYARHFPSLQSLTVTGFGRYGKYEDWTNIKHEQGTTIHKFWKNHGDFLKVFFPIRQDDDSEGEGPHQMCKTVKYLDIPYSAISTTGIVNMFPNVFNKYLNKARKQQKRALPPPTGMTMKLRSGSRV